MGIVRYYKEYEINGCIFVKSNDKWYLVEPIHWEYNKKDKKIICRNDLFGLDPLLLNKNKMIYSFFVKDILIKDDSLSNDEKQKISNSRKKFLESNKLTVEDVKQKLDAAINNDKKNEEIDNIELEILLLLDKLKETSERLNKLKVRNQKTARIQLDEKIFLKEIDNHYEFKSEYIPYLKNIDLLI